MTYAAAVCCVILAVSDAKSGKIPNARVLVFSLAGLVWAFASGGTARLLASLCGAGGIFLLLWFPYVLRLMGAGDVKMFMMLGIYFGWPGILCVFAASVLTGSVYAAARLIKGKDAGRRFSKLLAYLDEIRSGGKPESYIGAAEKDARVSFAVFAAIGAVICAAAHIC